MIFHINLPPVNTVKWQITVLIAVFHPIWVAENDSLGSVTVAYQLVLNTMKDYHLP